MSIDFMTTVHTATCVSCGHLFTTATADRECGTCWDMAHGNLSPQDIWEF